MGRTRTDVSFIRRLRSFPSPQKGEGAGFRAAGDLASPLTRDDPHNVGEVRPHVAATLPREELEIAGVRIPRGALVFGAFASANRDERQFSDPDRLDLARMPNRHLAFGQSGHFCIGAALARMEGRIAITKRLRRLPDLRLAAAPAWRGGLVLRGLKTLPVMAEAE